MSAMKDPNSVSEDISNLDHDDPIRASVADVTGILDPVILDHALQEEWAKSEIAMGAGCTLPSSQDNDLFMDPAGSATHAEIPKGCPRRCCPRYGENLRRKLGGPSR